MPLVKFPPLETASPEGLLAIGGNLETNTLLSAYTQGIFPWPISKESPLTWFSPNPRGILMTNELHISKSFGKFLKKQKYEIRFNTRPKEIIYNCAEMKRKHEEGTWITEEILNAYVDFFNTSNVYTVEVYKDDILVGGLYGVTINSYLSGESMFHTEPNVSKLALYYLLKIAKANNIPWVDTQMVTPVIESFGGKHIARKKFIKLLSEQTSKQAQRKQIFNFSTNQLDQL